MTADLQARFERFRSLHHTDEAFVMPNAWDAGSARILSALGYDAVGTTSAGLAFSRGVVDSSASLSREDILDNARSIAAASSLPVSGDLENGFGHAPSDCALTIERASDAGLVGGSIEDATGDAANPIYAFEHAVERVAAAADVARRRSLLLTARSENFLWGRPDLDDTLKRLQAFVAAGADVVYAPGLPDLDAIELVCREVSVPVNVVMGLSGTAYTRDQLSAVGVRRISVGGSFARAALGEFVRAAEEVRDHGTFTYASRAIPDAEAAAFMTVKGTE